MGIATESLRKGCELGFAHAREHPEDSLEDFMEQIDHLQVQLQVLPSWKLRLMTNEGTFLDRMRLRFERKR